jgi:hypothetical protein
LVIYNVINNMFIIRRVVAVKKVVVVITKRVIGEYDL